MKSKIKAIILMVCMLTTLILPTNIFAATNTKEYSQPDIVPKDIVKKEVSKALAQSLDSITEQVGLLDTIAVYVNEPCDEEWRDNYGSNWMYWANYAVEMADNKLYELFGIDYYSVAQNTWSSSSTDIGDLLEEATNEIGLTNGADIMVAFTGQYCQGFGGLSYQSESQSLVVSYGSYWDWRTTRHESGHLYSLSHCDNWYSPQIACIMNTTSDESVNFWYNPDSFCTAHENQWGYYKNKF